MLRDDGVGRERGSYETWNSRTPPIGTWAARIRPGSSGTDTCRVVPAVVPGGTRTNNSFCPGSVDGLRTRVELAC